MRRWYWWGASRLLPSALLMLASSMCLLDADRSSMGTRPSVLPNALHTHLRGRGGFDAGECGSCASRGQQPWALAAHPSMNANVCRHRHLSGVTMKQRATS